MIAGILLFLAGANAAAGIETWVNRGLARASFYFAAMAIGVVMAVTR